MSTERRRRGVGARLVDTGLVVLGLGYGAVWALALLDEGAADPELLLRNFVLTVAASAALWLRRRWPLAVAAGTAAVATYADLASGAQLIALFTLAATRPARMVSAVAGGYIAARTTLVLLLADADTRVMWVLALNACMTLAAVGWGMYVRHRRELLRSLRERAAEAEERARRRAEDAQRAAREDIAREIHDVLGHRLSLLSVHAGALEYRPDASKEEVAGAARVIRASAHQALQDLREVIGVLRAPTGELPQPTLGDVSRLVADARAAGMRVRLRQEVADGPPDALGRTAFRVVQEGLTNARKHAPGSEAEVELRGAPGLGLTVTVDNGPSPAAGTDAAAAQAGEGLIGLAERASLLGGHVEHGARRDGGFRVRAWLPWHSD